ncbi:O-antigen ligase family protein [Lapidilactobacillus luobeiensis]|uniref:O-antigen ligase family protein n=1 Tax=Lapidilactobacillus luobeiensis TaxID=2950371 RepID=UPI0021C4AFEC|nr:hypothetical protein [Lapidilactobacillus luobeiensis]
MVSKQITKFEKSLLLIFFFELFAGGGGRLLAVGPLSIRQILFFLVMAVFFIRFCLNVDSRNEILSYFKKPTTAVFWLSVSMLLWIMVSTAIGFLHHHPTGDVLRDTFRVIFVVAVIPLIYYLGKNRFTLADFVKVLFIASIVVSLLTITISLIGKFQTDRQFYFFYKDINKIFPGDLFFRPSRGVFYKSHFLVLFTMIISSVMLMDKKINYFYVTTLGINAISIILSETRGLFLGYFVGLLIYVIVRAVIARWGKEKFLWPKKIAIKRIIFLVMACGLTFYFYGHSTVARFSQPGGDIPEYQKENEEDTIKDISMNIRNDLMKASIKIIKKSKVGLVVGNGYGTKIGKRTTGIEMSFVDILVEQGVIGVLAWLLFTLLPLFYYFKSFLRTGSLASINIGLLACTISMLLVTNINPFLNSPIGLGFLIPVIVYAYKLSINSKETA